MHRKKQTLITPVAREVGVGTRVAVQQTLSLLRVVMVVEEVLVAVLVVLVAAGAVVRKEVR